MSQDPVRYAVDNEIAVVTVDDGRANALSHAVIDALGACLDRAAAEEAKAVVMTGRPGRFCAGFDLNVMMAGPSQRRKLVEEGAHLFLRMYEFPRPIVLACTGHALAAGAVWLTACDWRVGADVEAKIGLNEVAIGLPLPIFALELARARLASHRVLDATAHARIYSPREAVEVGYLDEVAAEAEVMARAMERAAALGALRDPAYSHTKQMVRAAVSRHIRSTLEEDMDRIG
ncbi:MAG TPA: crotonase/enoyl-CoA hydratase family protein [Candidatus Limnocylindrales bacterium]|nr:crotonase/enoyl-CoA hydratase family protein [Candidatus Limnocylindrales bacterium]